MKHWNKNRSVWLKDNPYRGPYKSPEDAEAWASRIREVHSDSFRVIQTPEGWHVEQDLNHG